MKLRSQLNVNLGFLAENVSALKSLCPSNEIIFMVKANAYGHGIVEIARYCVEELEIKYLGCASLHEALFLRTELPELEFEIYVFSDSNFSSEDKYKAYLEKRIIPIVHNIEDLDFLLSDTSFKKMPLCLKINTGMNRLGINSENIDLVVDKLKKNGIKKIHHLMSHLACSSLSMSKNNQNKKQMERFSEIKKYMLSSGFEIEQTSISNSGAIEQKFGLEETHIRPGLLLYGPSTLIEPIREISHWNGKVISEFESSIIDIREIKKGTPIGYGATICPEDGLMVVVAAGYGDGLLNSYQGAHLNIEGYEGRILGRVNMDMLQVLLPLDAKNEVSRDKRVSFWNSNRKNFEKLSDEIKMIPYEMFCSVSERVPRIYKR